MVYPSTEGSGRRVSRLMPMTEVIVLIAATPSQPAVSAVRAGNAMSVMLGVIFAHTGLVAFALIQPQTSCAQKMAIKARTPTLRR